MGSLIVLSSPTGIVKDACNVFKRFGMLNCSNEHFIASDSPFDSLVHSSKNDAAAIVRATLLFLSQFARSP